MRVVGGVVAGVAVVVVVVVVGGGGGGGGDAGDVICEERVPERPRETFSKDVQGRASNSGIRLIGFSCQRWCGSGRDKVTFKPVNASNLCAIDAASPCTSMLTVSPCLDSPSRSS